MKSSSTSDDVSTSIYQEPIEIQFPSDLTSKVQSLSDQIAQLQSNVTKLLKSFNQLNVPPLSYPQYSQQTSSAFDIICEFSDQENRKHNLIVHLPESPTPNTLNTNMDTSSFTILCNSLGVKAQIISVTQLGRNLTNKCRPLQECLDNEVNKRKHYMEICVR